MSLLKSAANVLSTVQLAPVVNGAIAGSKFDAAMLWHETPAAIFVIRRAGCALCRENAKEISARFASGEFAGARLYGIIKEVAPVKGAETDKELGVKSFESNYFRNNELYIDTEKAFYTFLGNKSLFSQKLHTWNPITLWKDYKALRRRLKEKSVYGNLKGEGLLKGGFLIIHPTKGVVYKHEDVMGSLMPMGEIREALRTMDPSAYNTTPTTNTTETHHTVHIDDDNIASTSVGDMDVVNGRTLPDKS